MGSEIDLGSKAKRGGLVAGLAAVFAVIGMFITPFVGSVYQLAWLIGMVVFFDLTIFLLVFGIQNQIDAFHMAMIGVHDRSDFSLKIRQATDPSKQLEQLESKVLKLKETLDSLSKGGP